MAEAEDAKMTESKEKGIDEKKKDEIWYRVRPYHTYEIDAENGEFNARVEMPGVPKDKVTLKILPELFTLKGQREHTLYTLTEYFPYLIDVDNVDANYESGLLTLKGKFKDRLADAIEINL